MKLQLLAPLLAGPLLTASALFMNSVPGRDSMVFAVHTDPVWVRSTEGKRTILFFRLLLLFLLLATIGTAFSPAFLFAPALLPLIGTGGFTVVRARVKLHAAPNPAMRVAPLTARGDGAAGALIICAAALIPLTAAAYWLKLHWDSIPERFPVHWDLQGHANRWNTKTVGGVYGALTIAAATTLLMLLIAIAMVGNAPRGESGGMRRATLRMLAGMSWLTNLLCCAIALNAALRLNVPIPLATVGFLAGTLTLAWPVMRESRRNGGDPTPDEAWKLGMFYYNPNDPALLVQARFGVGYALNFGNRMAWILSVASLAVPVLAIVIAGS